VDNRRLAAAQQLDEAITSFTDGQSNLVQFIQRARDACLRADLPEDAEWFRRELEGCERGVELPSYRAQVSGTRQLEPRNPLDIQPGSAVRQMNELSGLIHPELDSPPVPTTKSVNEDIASVIEAYQNGFIVQDGEWIAQRGLGGTAYYRYVLRFQPAVFRAVVHGATNAALGRARTTEITLRFGNAVQDILEHLRQNTERAIGGLGLDPHFAAIREGIQSNNPEQWRSAMWECRSVIEALANRLWQDPSGRYQPIPINGRPMATDQGKPINRLIAYLHCRGVTGSAREAISAELELLNASLHKLYGLDSRAHDPDPIDRSDAELAVVLTYALLAQFVQRTDLEPVMDQAGCAVRARADEEVHR
jgi:hypothetical protein